MTRRNILSSLASVFGGLLALPFIGKGASAKLVHKSDTALPPILLKLVSDGTPGGTKLIDNVTGREVVDLLKFSIHVDAEDDEAVKVSLECYLNSFDVDGKYEGRTYRIKGVPYKGNEICGPCDVTITNFHGVKVEDVVRFDLEASFAGSDMGHEFSVVTAKDRYGMDC